MTCKAWIMKQKLTKRLLYWQKLSDLLMLLHFVTRFIRTSTVHNTTQSSLTQSLSKWKTKCHRGPTTRYGMRLQAVTQQSTRWATRRWFCLSTRKLHRQSHNQVRLRPLCPLFRARLAAAPFCLRSIVQQETRYSSLTRAIAVVDSHHTIETIRQ